MSQRRYQTESEIVAVIDEAILQCEVTKKEAILHRKMAQSNIKKSRSDRNGNVGWWIEQAADCDSKAAKAERRIERIEKKIQQLKRTLADFRTGDLFGEPTVPLQQ